MLTDLRFIIGAFFVSAGVTLLATGLFGPSDVVEGIINLGSGAVMLVLGLLVMFTGMRYSRRPK